MKYNVLIVDDEFLARKLLQDYVSKIESLNIVGSCQSVVDAVNVLHNEKVDIMLVDIQMPDVNGMEFVASLTNKPAIIFTTAYSEYAVDAFSLGVVDYLLKPFDFPRFFQAIDKAIESINGKQLSTENEHITPDSITNSADYILVKADYKLYKINYRDILYIEGQHEYVTFHTPAKRITALYSLKNLEENLPSRYFVRVHKSFIVSFDRIQDVDKNNVTVAGVNIPIGANYRDALFAKLQGL